MKTPVPSNSLILNAANEEILRKMCLFFALQDKKFLEESTEIVQLGKVNFQQTYSYYDTLLHMAARLNLPEFVTMFLNNGADVNVKNADGVTPLQKVISRETVGPDKTAKILLDHPQINLNISVPEEINPIHAFEYALLQDNIKVVSLMLQKDPALVNGVCNSDPKMTYLMVACQKSQPEIVELFFEQKTPCTVLNVQDQRGGTALIHAVYAGNENVINSSKESEDNGEAIRKSREAVIKILLAKGCDTSLKDDRGDTARMIANAGYFYAAQIILWNHKLQLDAEIEAKMKEAEAFLRTGISTTRSGKKRTAADVLGSAIQAGDAKEVSSILQKDPNLVNSYCSSEPDITYLMLACQNKNADIVKLFFSQEVSCNVINNGDWEGNTALMFASEAGHKEIVRILLARHNCRVDLANEREDGGITAYDAAMNNKHFDVADILDVEMSFQEIENTFQTIVTNAGYQNIINFFRKAENPACEEVKRNIVAFQMITATQELQDQDTTSFRKNLNDPLDVSPRSTVARLKKVRSGLIGAGFKNLIPDDVERTLWVDILTSDLIIHPEKFEESLLRAKNPVEAPMAHTTLDLIGIETGVEVIALNRQLAKVVYDLVEAEAKEDVEREIKSSSQHLKTKLIDKLKNANTALSPQNISDPLNRLSDESVNLAISGGWTISHFVAALGTPANIEKLLEKKPDLNARARFEEVDLASLPEKKKQPFKQRDLSVLDCAVLAPDLKTAIHNVASLLTSPHLNLTTISRGLDTAISANKPDCFAAICTANQTFEKFATEPAKESNAKIADLREILRHSQINQKDKKPFNVAIDALSTGIKTTREAKEAAAKAERDSSRDPAVIAAAQARAKEKADAKEKAAAQEREILAAAVKAQAEEDRARAQAKKAEEVRIVAEVRANLVSETQATKSEAKPIINANEVAVNLDTEQHCAEGLAPTSHSPLALNDGIGKEVQTNQVHPENIANEDQTNEEWITLSHLIDEFSDALQEPDAAEQVSDNSLPPYAAADIWREDKSGSSAPKTSEEEQVRGNILSDPSVKILNASATAFVPNAGKSVVNSKL